MPVAATSLAARSSPRPALKQRARVFQYILAQADNGATLDELHHALGLPINVCCPRRQELEKKGFLVYAGKNRTTTSGRQAQIWIVPASIRTRAIALLSKGS